MQNANPEQPLTLAELDAILAEEQRSQRRIEHRNRAQVICLAQGPTVRSDVTLVWTEDVSESGARLSFPHPVQADRFWIRLPGNVDRQPFIECRVQWTDDSPTTADSGSASAEYHCGVRFERTLTREEFENLLGRG